MAYIQLPIPSLTSSWSNHHIHYAAHIITYIQLHILSRTFSCPYHRIHSPAHSMKSLQLPLLSHTYSCIQLPVISHTFSCPCHHILSRRWQTLNLRVQSRKKNCRDKAQRFRKSSLNLAFGSIQSFYTRKVNYSCYSRQRWIW